MRLCCPAQCLPKLHPEFGADVEFADAARHCQLAALVMVDSRAAMQDQRDIDMGLDFPQAVTIDG